MSSEKKYDLEERTALFAERIIDLCKKVSKNTITMPIVSQIVRCGTSIGANYCEANGASSKKDFRNKIYTCKKESKEVVYWLRILSRADELTKDDCGGLSKEAHELVLIFSAIAKNSGQ